MRASGEWGGKTLLQCSQVGLSSSIWESLSSRMAAAVGQRLADGFAAESSRRKAEFSFEGTVKGRLSLITDFTGDGCHAIARRFEQLCAKLKSSVGEIRNRSFPEISLKTLR
ncbi:MAG: hypothetical protein NTAFB01_06710 [Nitrospira sp.]